MTLSTLSALSQKLLGVAENGDAAHGDNFTTVLDFSLSLPLETSDTLSLSRAFLSSPSSASFIRLLSYF